MSVIHLEEVIEDTCGGVLPYKQSREAKGEEKRETLLRDTHLLPCSRRVTDGRREVCRALLSSQVNICILKVIFLEAEVFPYREPTPARHISDK